MSIPIPRSVCILYSLAALVDMELAWECSWSPSVVRGNLVPSPPACPCHFHAFLCPLPAQSWLQMNNSNHNLAIYILKKYFMRLFCLFLFLKISSFHNFLSPDSVTKAIEWEAKNINVLLNIILTCIWVYRQHLWKCKWCSMTFRFPCLRFYWYFISYCKNCFIFKLYWI